MGGAVWWTLTRWGRCDVQCKSCVIHTWALHKWCISLEALYKCHTFYLLPLRRLLLMFCMFGTCCLLYFVKSTFVGLRLRHLLTFYLQVPCINYLRSLQCTQPTVEQSNCGHCRCEPLYPHKKRYVHWRCYKQRDILQMWEYIINSGSWVARAVYSTEWHIARYSALSGWQACYSHTREYLDGHGLHEQPNRSIIAY